MKAADADILIVPGYEGSGQDHWQTRWERKLSTASRVEQASWTAPDRDAWRARLVESAKAAMRPVVLVAHSLGVITAVQAAPQLGGKVRGALLVTPPDLDSPAVPIPCRSFAPVPRAPLPFPAFLVASRTDPYCSFDRAETYARDWRAFLVDAGAGGHLNAESGHGPWPEGLFLFSCLLKELSATPLATAPKPA